MPAAAFLSVAPLANADPCDIGNGVCDGGNVCMWQHAGETGSRADARTCGPVCLVRIAYHARRVSADSDTFSLTTLQAPEDRALVEGARRRAVDACMVAKGFIEPPKPGHRDYAGAYGMALAGDDAASKTPPRSKSLR